MSYKNVEKPSTELSNLLVEGIRRHGAAGLQEKMKMAWSLIANASHGIPVQAEKIPDLEDRIKIVLGKERNHIRLYRAMGKMSLKEKKNLYKAICDDFLENNAPIEEMIALSPIMEQLTADKAGCWMPLAEREAV